MHHFERARATVKPSPPGRVPVLLPLLLIASQTWAGDTYYVAVDGNDGNPGTLDRPIATLQVAISKAGPGDTILLRGGTYRQTSDLYHKCGSADQPIRIAGFKGEKAILDGRETVAGAWKPYQGGIFQTPTPDKVEQLFLGDEVMTEARWPDAKFAERWDRTKWARSDVGSELGKMISADFRTSDVDWTGAFVVLNVNHQWHTWIRPVLSYDKAALSFAYDRNLPEIPERFAAWTSWYWDDFFYLFGKLEALDAEEEWFYDAKARVLYFHPPGKREEPSRWNVSYKKRDYGIRGRKTQHVIIENLHFFGCTLDIQQSSFVTVDNCHFRFPSHARFIKELEAPFSHAPDRTPGTKLHGDHNQILNSSLAFSSTYGLYVKGAANVVSNCVIHDVNCYGPLVYPALLITDRGEHHGQTFDRATAVTRNTIYNCGSVAITHYGSQREITYNHIFNGGLTSRDVSLIYTSSPSHSWNTVAYNWVHGATDIAIRGDDNTYRQSIHHNVIWDSIEGIVAKGEQNEIYNNTCFAKNPKISILLSMAPLQFTERHRRLWDFLAKDEGQRENQRSLCFNNVANSLRTLREDIAPTPNIRNNVLLSDPRIVPEDLFVDFKGLDFRPRAGGPLCQKGVALTPNSTVSGQLTDIGAYGHEGSMWVPGATWLDCGEQPSHSLREARQLAIRKLGYDASEIWWKRDLEKLKELEREFAKKRKSNPQ